MEFANYLEVIRITRFLETLETLFWFAVIINAIIFGTMGFKIGVQKNKNALKAAIVCALFNFVFLYYMACEKEEEIED